MRFTQPASEFLEEREPGSVACIITDPPWKISGGGKFGECADYPLLTVAEIAASLRPARRAMAQGAHLYCWAPAGDVLPEILERFASDGWRFIRQLAWDRDWKWGLGAYRNVWEPVLVFSNGADPRGFNAEPVVPSLIKARSAGVRTAKPWQLYKTFMEKSTAPGDLVADPFCGTNPLEVAARRLQPARRWLAADVLSPAWIQKDMEARSQKTPEVASSTRRAGHRHPGEDGLAAWAEGGLP